MAVITDSSFGSDIIQPHHTNTVFLQHVSRSYLTLVEHYMLPDDLREFNVKHAAVWTREI